ncbi:dienelactone hydrolase family protein [Rubrivirga sp. S365]|uniref:Dienelactone hydrolase family protein n=1 Tax=Rubrivirga litoralis TaxID=3075598 RepID=A0ABU3BR36_9BACT|nr:MULTISPECIES: dienelactone hydrolase family protein [unclassified Rubrivirga]MDT0631753.1 dienelactone hydrolase family protein [Rubrivirga sp. F394]MDT7856082.1 dienelactone hydrolase family protein [Rubrivirga sp. S365]
MPLRLRLAALLALVLALPACDGLVNETIPPAEPPDETVQNGVSFGRLFGEPTAAELAAVEADWAGRNTAPSEGRVVGQARAGGATLYVVEHETVANGSPTVTHYGIVRVPDGVADAPVVVVHHGGDGGVQVAAFTANDGVLPFASVFAPIAAETVQVFPVYRSETVDTGALPALGGPYTAGGAPSPWDYDVDDAIALLTATLELFGEETDEDRVAAIGFSRGANVALLQAVRDDRIDAVVDYYGPADFYSEGAQRLTGALLLPESNPTFQQAIGLPGAPYLLNEVLDPLRAADDTYDADADYGPARLDIARRSPGLFADRLSAVQVHHHYRDGIVPFSFSEAFAARAGGAAASFELFPYGAPPASAGDLSILYHAPEAEDMRPSIPTVLAFLGAELGLRAGAPVPAL